VREGKEWEKERLNKEIEKGVGKENEMMNGEKGNEWG
jgi:uncharacterized protein YdaU (DUF1376 family)